MEQCDQHSKIQQEVEDIKTINKEQWSCLNELKKTKVGTSSATWAIGIFIILSLAVVGFLWKGQVSLADKIENVQEKTDIKRQEILNKIDGMNNVMIEIKTKLDLQIKHNRQEKKTIP